MKKKNRIFGIYLPIYLLICAAAVTLKTVGGFYYLDRYGYYGDAVIMTVANLLVTAGAVFFLSYIAVGRSDLRLVPSFTSPMNYIPSGIVSAALVFIAVGLFKYSVAIPADIDNHSLRLNKYVALIAAVLAVASLLYFLFATVLDKRISAKRASLGIIFLLFLCFYVAFIYFDVTFPINATNKIIDQTTYLFISVFFLYEVRLSMGREKWRAYVAFGLTASLLAAYSSIPALILYFAEGRVTSIFIYESILTAAIFIFILFKLLLTLKLTEDRESEFVTALTAAAKAREEELSPKPEEPVAEENGDGAEGELEPDENQISISDITEEEGTAESLPEAAEEPVGDVEQ